MKKIKESTIDNVTFFNKSVRVLIRRYRAGLCCSEQEFKKCADLLCEINNVDLAAIYRELPLGIQDLVYSDEIKLPDNINIHSKAELPHRKQNLYFCIPNRHGNRDIPVTILVDNFPKAQQLYANIVSRLRAKKSYEDQNYAKEIERRCSKAQSRWEIISILNDYFFIPGI